MLHGGNITRRELSMNNKEYMIKQLIGNRTNVISNYISVRSETVTINEYELDFRDQGTRSCSTNGAKATAQLAAIAIL